MLENDCENYDFQATIFIWLQLLKKNCNGEKQIVKVTKNDFCFNRCNCYLCRNKARMSVSQIFVTVTKYFFSCNLTYPKL